MRINHIFRSVDGEVNYFGQGTYATFIRFAGCNLNCSYCDTEYARKADSGKVMSIEGVYEAVCNLKCRKITITGGEPLTQPDPFKMLANKLRGEGYFITVETNGSMPLIGMGIDSWIVDYKLPSSGMHETMIWNNFISLRSVDFVKFVVANKRDFKYAVKIKEDIQKTRSRCRFAFSPVLDELPPIRLFSWLEEARIFDVILNIQLHKLIGLP